LTDTRSIQSERDNHHGHEAQKPRFQIIFAH
jgi:hypothetical protein